MKKQTFSLLAGAVLAVALLLVSCHSSYEVTKVEAVSYTHLTLPTT